MRKCAWTALIVLSALAVIPSVAHAQAARSGPTFRIGGSTSPVILPDVAYDPMRDRYLVVSGNGFIEGQLLKSNGVRVQNFPVTMGSLAGGYAQTPRVEWSSDLNSGNGGYLVTWHESVGPIAQVRGKFISPEGVALSGDFVIATEAATAGGSHWIMGAAIAYSTASREFLVTWMGGYGSTQDIRFTRINVQGQLLQGTVPITGGVDWERDPSVTYNPAQDEFYIAYAGYVDAGAFGYVNGQRIKAGTGALIGGPTTFIRSVATLVPAVEYNRTTGQYLVGWYNRSSASAAIYGVTLGGDGAVLSDIRVLSARYFAYDALDIAAGGSTGDFLLVTHGAGLQDYEDAAVPINANGTPYDNGFILTNTPDVRPVTAGDGNFNPRVVSNGGGRYLAVTSSKFAAIHAQFAQSSASGGGGGQPPPPPSLTSDPKIFLDSPANGSLVQPTFAVAGWAVDLGSPAGAGTGMATVHIWAFPTSGAAPTFLGASTMGIGRPDIAGHFGRSDFATAGFVLQGSLAPGSYDVVAYAFSVVAGKFNATAGARITVTSPISAAPNPKMFIDSPHFGQAVQTSFAVGGWAVDLGATSGSGAAAVHVWAYPSNGASPVFVGATGMNVARPDVGAHFGDARFSTGFSLQGSLPPGAYTLVVFAFSTVTGSFNQAAAVPISVQ
jgi:hypothetical protein